MSKTDIVQLLKEGNTVQIYPQGNSMMPFIYPQRNEVVISPDVDHLRQYDIILFRSNQTGLLTLHRIMEIQDNCYLVSGDNQYVLETVYKDQVLGVVIEIIRNGKIIYMDDPLYRIGARLYTNNKQTINVLRKLKNRFHR